MKHKILIVEDEPEIVRLIRNRLDVTLYDVTIAYDGDEALELIKTQHFDLLSLDIMLPSVDGLTLCDEVRKRHKDSLIIIVSALDLDEQKEKAYVLGADDYMVKPFSPKLLALKIASLLKRRKEMNQELQKTDSLLVNTLQYHKDLKCFYVKNSALVLTLSEYTILEVLYSTPKKLFSKEELSQILYNKNVGNIDKKGIGTHLSTTKKNS